MRLCQPFASLYETSGLNQREIFFRHLAQTSNAPLALEIVRAEGNFLFDKNERQWLDLIGGISVANLGHRHPGIIAAIKKQLDAYLHIMVYGEFIESPQVQYAKLLTEYLPKTLNSVYFTNSGAEAVEGAMKLSKKITGRNHILAFNNSYHGSTQGALSIIGDEYWRNAFRPLLPGIQHGDYNIFESLDLITEETACVIAETVQAEAGIIVPSAVWMQALQKKCSENGVLLVLDEIQAGFGRTGRLWGFEHFNIIPDILLLGKAMGGGMPLGAFIADKKLMDSLSENPVLGHITTFGGHPVSCAAGMAGLQILLEEKIIDGVKEREQLFLDLLAPASLTIRSFGLWMAIEFDDAKKCKQVTDRCLEKGLLTDWFLFAPQCLRISPPLNISKDQVKQACDIILSCLPEN